MHSRLSARRCSPRKYPGLGPSKQETTRSKSSAGHLAFSFFLSRWLSGLMDLPSLQSSDHAGVLWRTPVSSPKQCLLSGRVPSQRNHALRSNRLQDGALRTFMLQQRTENNRVDTGKLGAEIPKRWVDK